ncbi:ATP-binding cassette domain-containing protein [Hyphobacterium sp. CCMP332]|nr:ATP-binding cassette domain-containing protein [Hyphobacterium sp. CCMP332]
MGFRISELKPLFFKENPNSQIWNSHFNLKNQQKYLICAPSGKGKSSFFNMLAAINKDYNGLIEYEGKLLKDVRTDQLSKFRFMDWSLVFQNLALFKDLSLEENLNIRGDSEDCMEWLHQLGLEDKLYQRVGHLSYGERQRLAIIKSLNRPYNFLIMDEPFSHLDAELKKKALQLIERDVKIKNASLIIFDLENDPRYIDYQKLML